MLLNPVLEENLEDQLRHYPQSWNLSELLEGPLPNSVMRHHLRHLPQLLHHLRHRHIEKLHHGALQHSVLA